MLGTLSPKKILAEARRVYMKLKKVHFYILSNRSIQSLKYPNFVPFRARVGCFIITCFDLINSADCKPKHNKQDHADEGLISLWKGDKKIWTTYMEPLKMGTLMREQSWRLHWKYPKTKVRLSLLLTLKIFHTLL